MKRFLPHLFALALFLAPALATAGICAGNYPASNPDSIYTVNADGTVSDSRTGLIWDRCAWGQTGADCSGGSASTHTWAQALAVAASANNANYKGHVDWRLPNIKELRSLVEECRWAPSINASIFPNITQYNADFWSSSPAASNRSNAWSVLFFVGTSSHHDRDFWYSSVRLVRGGQSFDSLGGGGSAPPVQTVTSRSAFGEWWSQHADPVDTATGAMLLQHDLLGVQGAQPLTFTLRYNSRDPQDSVVGFGWSHGYDMALSGSAGSQVEIRWPTGNRTRYTPNGAAYAPVDGNSWDVLEYGPAAYPTGWRLRGGADGNSYYFDAAGQLVEIVGHAGEHITLEYAGGRLSRVVEPVSGRALSYTYNGQGRVQSVTGNGLGNITLAYDAAGNLSGISNTANQTVFNYTYNTAHRVLTGLNGAGEQAFSNTYSNGRVISQDDGVSGNLLTQFAYGTDSLGNSVTTSTDRVGAVTTFTFDSQYRLIKKRDPLGNETRYEYDANGSRTREIDPSGLAVSMTYNDRGRLTSRSDGTITVSYVYDTRDNLVEMNDGQGHRSVMTYDANNRLLSTTNARNETWSYQYDANGLLTRETAPDGGISTYAYTGGLLRQVTDPAGLIATYAYDAAGRLISGTNPRGKVTTYAFDTAGQLASVTDPLNRVVAYAYDAAGRLSTLTDPLNHVTRYSYTRNGKPLTETDALNGVVRYTYDGEDRLVSVTDPLGRSVQFQYDLAGRMVKTIDPKGNAVESVLDAAGYETQRSDPLGGRIMTAYDALHRPTAITSPLGARTEFGYNILGQLTTRQDPLGRQTQYEYDALSTLVRVTDPANGTAQRSTNVLGLVAWQEDPNGQRKTFTYDLAGKLLREQDAAGSARVIGYDSASQDLPASMTNAKGQATTLTYDNAGRLARMADAVGTIDYSYNANDQVLTVIEDTPEGPQVTRRTYDELGRLTRYVDPFGNVIEYSYDAAGNLTQLKYPGGKTVSYQYDSANLLTRVTDWANRQTVYTYDQLGRVLTVTNVDGSVAASAYDADGKLDSLTSTRSNGETIVSLQYTHDAAGRIIQIDGQPVPASMPPGLALTYGPDNRLATVNGVSVIYDAEGNLTRGPHPYHGDLANYGFDARNRLVSLEGTTFRYDAEDRLININAYGSDRLYVMDPSAPLDRVLMETDGSGNPVAYYVYGMGLIGRQDAAGNYAVYHYDHLGTTLALTSASDGAVTDRYYYGPYGEPMGGEGATDNPFRFNGRYGVRTLQPGIYYMRARFYNPYIKRFINKDLMNGDLTHAQSMNTYAYANGAPVSMIDPFGLEASLVTDFVPFVGTVKSGVELVTGKDPFTGEPVNRFGAAVGLIPYGKVFSRGGKVVKTFREIDVSWLMKDKTFNSRAMSDVELMAAKIKTLALSKSIKNNSAIKTMPNRNNSLTGKWRKMMKEYFEKNYSQEWREKNGEIMELLFDGKKGQIDHLTELQLGGADDYLNMVVSPATVNGASGRAIYRATKDMPYGSIFGGFFAP